jgi:cytochrome c oxidase subunit 1
MPRRYYNYLPEFEFYHKMSTIGAFLLGVGLFIALWVLLKSLKSGAKAPANPWGSATLEWQCSSPPPHDNFSHTPTVGDPYDLESTVYDPKLGGYKKIASPAPAH